MLNQKVLFISLLITVFISLISLQSSEQPPDTNGVTLELRLPGPNEGLIADPTVNKRFVPPRNNPSRAPQTANININFNPADCPNATIDWPSDAEAAYLYAASIWEGLLVSSQTIEVDACWSVLGNGVLGSAGAARIHGNFSGAPIFNVWYPAALANSLSNSDLDSTSPDIFTQFNSNFNWYFGTDGNPSSNQYDFVSVVLHELGHGLGFAGSMLVSGGTGTYGFGSGFPFAYDTFSENGSNTPLVGGFTNGSAALAAQLTSNDIFFDGPNASGANGNSPVDLYAPSTFRQGSSFSHLAQNFNNTDHALMTHSLSNGEAIHDVGDVTLGLFEDLGWDLAGDPPAEEPTAIPTETQTLIPTSTATQTLEPTPTSTETLVPTAAPTETTEPTAVPTETAAPTISAAETATATLAPTETLTPLPTATETAPPTSVPNETQAPLPTATETLAPLPTGTATLFPAETPTQTTTPDPSVTVTPTAVPTETLEPMETAVATQTPVPSVTPTVPTDTNPPNSEIISIYLPYVTR